MRYLCIQREYVPICFRRGVQIPLYKGKNACSLDPNNYRGITLLSSFNKLFEILLWSRLEHWWHVNRIVLSSNTIGSKRRPRSRAGGTANVSFFQNGNVPFRF